MTATTASKDNESIQAAQPGDDREPIAERQPSGIAG